MDVFMKKVKRLLAFLCAAAVGLAALPARAQEMPRRLCEEQAIDAVEQLSLYAAAAVLMDADSGRVLYDKNGSRPMAMASTTKIMTCIVALENGNPLDEADISAYAASMPKVKLYVKKGERYVIGDLLRALMLESFNDTGVAIAEHIGKAYLTQELQQKSVSDFTVEESKQAVAAFAALMNRKAQDIGCTDTWFITPNGLDATQAITLEDGTTVQKEHSTTAADLAKIMAYCIKQSPKREEFLEITRMPNHCFSANGRSFSCNNHNAFLNMMDGALSGKTGFTNKAGYCYVGALERDGKTFTVALLACGWPNNKTYKWSDTRVLMEYGLNHYAYHAFDEVAYAENKLPEIPVIDGQTARLGETAYIQVEIPSRREDSGGCAAPEAAANASAGTISGLLLREDEKIDVKCQLQTILQAPVAAGTQVGTIYYSVGDQIYKTEQILTKDAIDKIDLPWCFRQIWTRYFYF